MIKWKTKKYRIQKKICGFHYKVYNDNLTQILISLYSVTTLSNIINRFEDKCKVTCQ